MWKTDLRIELADEERQDLQRLDRSLMHRIERWCGRERFCGWQPA
jgi:hypothetical protein